MATFRKRCGKWNVQIRRDTSAPISRTFIKKSDAEEWARHMEVQADRHDLAPSREAMAQYKISGILTRYKTEITVKKKSHISESRTINFLLRQPIADIALDILNESHICQFRDMRLETVKPATVVREIAILQHALEIAKREWHFPLRNNPAKGIKKPRINNARTRRLEKTEFEKLMVATNSCTNSHIKPIIVFALETGMRQGEIINAKWTDIDFQNRTLHIPITKNGHSRTIPLSQKALDLLYDRKAIGSEYMFPISSSSFQQSWKRLLKRTDIQNLHFHDLRHEAISRFFEIGLSVPEVALISGHRDFKMLFRYTHLKPEELAKKLY